ncbi:MAG: hypothetical protein KAI03_00680 [Candidatus Aureabacteria bacterium]|nr:hypothetical protein [Candidatus Auribacterota bacterium]
MNRIFIFFCVFAVIPVSLSRASHLSFTATLTVDNHYGLYFGDGENVTFVGGNEIGAGGNPGQYNWSCAETFTFDVDLCDYIYVAAWSDDYVAQGFLGQFVSDAGLLLTNTSAWEVYPSWKDLDDGDSVPSQFVMNQEIAVASWSPVTYNKVHGSSPWGKIDGISDDASWIWGSKLAPGSNYGEFQIFRTQVIPELSTFLLLFYGLIGLVILKKSI